MLKRLSVVMGLVVVMMLGGCSSTVSTVHLFSKYMTEEETQQAQTWFTEKGYVVETNSHPFPNGIYQSTLVFSPGLRSYTEIQPLVDAYRNETGQPLGTRYFGSGKHRFTKDNIGVYIFGSRKPMTPEEYKVSMMVEYAAVKCDKYEFAYLNLKEDSFELLIGNDTLERAEETTHTGRWQQDDNILSLYKEEKLWAAMEMRRIEEMTEYGLRKGRSLSPSLMTENIDNCLFEHTVVLK